MPSERTVKSPSEVRMLSGDESNIFGGANATNHTPVGSETFRTACGYTVG
jgi:hypothetical protein